jgi:hypothetical protein
MMNEVEYRAWLEENWTFERFRAFCEKHGHAKAARAYAPEELAELGRQYGKLDPRSTGLPFSLAAYWSILTYPAFGPFFWSSPIKIGLFFREFPLPMWDGTIERSRCPQGCDLFFGQESLPPDIMRQEVDHVSHGHKGYKTLIGGLEVTRKLLAGLFGIDSIDVPDGIVVSDIVKRFAPFDNRGRPFKGGLSKQSTHQREMFYFAASLFVEEITEHFGLRYVFILGASKNPKGRINRMLRSAEEKGWQIYQPLPVYEPWSNRPQWASGRSIIALPHPGAWGGALEKAVRIALGGEPDETG